MTATNPYPQLVDGVDIDLVVGAVRACPAVADLVEGPPGGVVSYLPGRKVPGVRVERDRICVQVRGKWGVPVIALAAQVRAALALLVAGRAIDVVIADVDVPPPERGAAEAGVPSAEVDRLATSSPGVVLGETSGLHEANTWTVSRTARGDASSSAPIIPTEAVTPPHSWRASQRSTAPPAQQSASRSSGTGRGLDGY